MNRYFRALGWAGAMLGVAAAGALGGLDEDLTTTLLFVLPVMAWLSLQGRMCCLRFGGLRR